MQDACDIDVTTNSKSTALHIAVANGHSRVVERLVGFGCSLSLQDDDGDTPLHEALQKDTADPLSTETPQLMKVCVQNLRMRSRIVAEVILPQEVKQRNLSDISLCAKSFQVSVSDVPLSLT